MELTLSFDLKDFLEMKESFIHIYRSLHRATIQKLEANIYSAND